MIRNAYGIARTWLSISRWLNMKNPSLRKSLKMRSGRPTIIAVGGNSFEGLERNTAENIVKMINSGQLPVITHGNGPQVGKLLAKHPEKTIAECVHITQVEMGREMKAALRSLIGDNGVEIEVIPTRILVAHDDPAFSNPTKYIGECYTLLQLQKMVTDSKNSIRLNKRRKIGEYSVTWSNGTKWIMKEVPGENGQYRKVVASPTPLAIYPKDFIKITESIKAGKLVIAVGGGGVAISQKHFADYYVEQAEEAVIDKDLASALLARDLKAKEMVISTGVRAVALNWGKKEQVDLGYMHARQALKKLDQDHFPAGSMGEKMEAAINALRFGVNTVLITHPASDWDRNEGTLLTRGIDLTGRAKNLVRRKPYEIQRWMVTREGKEFSSLAPVLKRYSPPRPFQS